MEEFQGQDILSNQLQRDPLVNPPMMISSLESNRKSATPGNADYSVAGQKNLFEMNMKSTIVDIESKHI